MFQSFANAHARMERMVHTMVVHERPKGLLFTPLGNLQLCTIRTLVQLRPCQHAYPLVCFVMICRNTTEMCVGDWPTKIPTYKLANLLQVHMYSLIPLT